MKRILGILFLALLVTSCSKTDKEKLEGSWVGDKIYKDGRIVCSYLPTEQDQIAEREYQKQKEVVELMQMSEYDFKQNIIRSMEQKLKMEFTFTPTDTLYIKTDDTPYKGEVWNFHILKETSQLVLEVDTRKVTYLYKVNREKLVLKNDGMKIVFRKKD